MDGMKKAKLRRIYSKGYFTPGVFLFIRGYLDSRFLMVDVQRGEKKYSLIKSPYLMRLMHNLSEYDTKLELKASAICEELGNKYTETCSKLSLLEEDIGHIQDSCQQMEKTGKQDGNWKRAMKKLESKGESLLNSADDLRIKREELRSRIEDIQQYKELCRDRMHSAIKARAYSYYDGCVMECYRECYICDEDFETQLFQDM